MRSLRRDTTTQALLPEADAGGAPKRPAGRGLQKHLREDWLLHEQVAQALTDANRMGTGTDNTAKSWRCPQRLGQMDEASSGLRRRRISPS